MYVYFFFKINHTNFPLFYNQAYKDVQGYLNSSCPRSLFSDLSKALDVKCQTVAKLSASLKDLTAGKL